MVKEITSIIIRDLEKLKGEILLYKNEAMLWKREGDVANSAGNLCLHLIGNLNTYIGAQLGNTGYTRNRPLEFSTAFVPREQLMVQLTETINVVASGLSILQDDDLKKEHPYLVWDQKTSVGFLLMHLAVHLGYHLGQINYHRRMMDS